MPAPLSRRQAVQLGAVVAGGWAVGEVLRRTAPIGRNVGPAADAILASGGSLESGPSDATLRFAVFSEYRCPACRYAFPAMEDAVRRDGQVRVIYKDWPIFGPPSERAASIALASAEQGIYPAVHRRLMTDSRIIADDMLSEVVTGAGGTGRARRSGLPHLRRWLRRVCARTPRKPFRSGWQGHRAISPGRCW